MKKKIYFLFGILVLFSLNFIYADIGVGTSGDIGVDLNIPTPVNYTSVNVNNSIYWNGNAWSDTRWLEIDGSNANQDIDIGIYNFTTTGIIDANTYLVDSGYGLFAGEEGIDGILSLVTGSDLGGTGSISLTLDGDLDNMYFQDDAGEVLFISTSDISTSTGEMSFDDDNIVTTGNVSASYFNGVNISNLGNVYVPYTGATGNVNLGENDFLVDTNTFYVDSSNHRVGIGTVTPSVLFHIAFDAGLGSELTTIPFATTAGWAHDGGGQYTYTTSLGTSYLIKNNFITIGKNYRLSYEIVANPDSTQLRADTLNFFTDSNLGSTVGIHTYDETALKDDMYLRVSGSQPSGLVIKDISIKELLPSSPNILDVKNTGNVGIGTATPQNTLNVIGDGNFTGNLTLGQKITFAFGEFIDNIVDGWVRITGNLNVTGNITAENVFLPAYIRVPNNNSQDVVVSMQWVNVTLDKKQTALQRNIGHTWNDSTNDTITINDAGIYKITYTASFVDSNPNPDAHIGMRLYSLNGASQIVKGSYSEVDTHRQDEEVFNSHSFLAEFKAGEQFKVQFTSDDTTVSSYLHATFEPGGSILRLSIHKVSNV